MPIIELYSQRKKRLTCTEPDDVYIYDEVPRALRVQLQQLFLDAIGAQYELGAYDFHAPEHNPEAWNFIRDALCREKGVHRLANERLAADDVTTYLGRCQVDDFLDVVELCAKYIERVLSKKQEHLRKSLGIKQNPIESIEEINFRFRQNSFGFQYENGEIIRLDSEFIHREIIRPALNFLSDPHFLGADEEFRRAHAHYRSGEYSQAILEAGKSLESTLKCVFEQKKWPYNKGDRAADLLKIARANGLWPEYLDRSFEQLLATLTSALPQIRNNEGAHGQGPSTRQIPPYLAAYALHLAATKIRLIIEAAKV
jgi:hypothetical protein